MDSRDPVMDAAAAAAGPAEQPARRKRTHRAGKKKKKSRRKSFALPADDIGHDDLSGSNGGGAFYSHRSSQLSNTSLDSVALLDHRDQPSLRPRRPSIAVTTGSSFTTHSQQQTPQQGGQTPGSSRLRTVYRLGESAGEEDEESNNEGAPLLSASARLAQSDGNLGVPGYGSNDHGRGRSVPRTRTSSGISFDKKKLSQSVFTPTGDSYNVNYPPSMPGSPILRPSDPTGLNFGDDLLRDEISRSEAMLARGDHAGIDPERAASLLASPLERRHTVCLPAEEDVCFPQDGMSEMGDDNPHADDGARGDSANGGAGSGRVRRRKARWPDLAVLEEWSQLEKEGRNHERRVKRITEPQLINGRLRPVDKKWFRADEDAPYRFTYFNEDFQSTIHSQSISELVQPGGSFRELFIPDPVIIEDSSSEEEEDEDVDPLTTPRYPPPGPTIPGVPSWTADSRTSSRQASAATQTVPGAGDARAPSQTQQRTLSPTAVKDLLSAAGAGGMSGRNTPTPGQAKSPTPPESKPLRYGERPVWWLDVLSPTEAEMRVISKTFGIHPLTAEDIIMQEAREKVELFRHYYFVNYRSFDQDEGSDNFLEPVNMYVVVFREGIITFHFSLTPHPANVRRRVRQLRDYMMLSADWISYAIIDDITDVFVPLIQKIEDDVDEIDDEVLGVHSSEEKGQKSSRGKDSDKDSATLRRIGDCRKKVMGLYRLLGNKADVIKGFAKRCNEHWEVAPRSDIGLYLGDIQDHIVTMTGNLSHYEKILARSHANYLAQINLRMNERQEETADILGKLTILGTIVLPMNLVTGLWGMNVWVPGQEMEGDLRWFFWITTSLITGGLLCFWVVKKAYGL